MDEEDDFWIPAEDDDWDNVDHEDEPSDLPEEVFD